MSKHKNTSFWGIDVDIPNDLLDQIENIIELYPDLHVQKTFHCTLLFVGRKSDIDESSYFALENKSANLHISAIAHSNFGVCLKVDKIIVNETEIDETQRHISVTNKTDKIKGTSISLVCGSIISCNHILTGIVKRHF